MKKLIALTLCMAPWLMSAMEMVTKEEKLYFILRNKVQQRDRQAVTRFLQKNKEFSVTKPCGAWRSIMSLAVGEDCYNEKIFRKLLTTISNINNTENYGFSPLMTAIAASNNEAVKLLIKKGANVNVRSTRQDEYNALDMTPLMKSSTLDDNAIMETLLAAKADPNLQDAQGKTALMYIAEQTYKTDPLTKAQLLMQAGAKILLEDNSGKTVLDREIKPELEAFIRQKGKREIEIASLFKDLVKSDKHYVYLLPQDIHKEIKKYL